MPPGERTITALKGKSGEQITTTLRVHAGTAVRMQALLQELRSKAAAGLEDYPFFDFNHEDGEASGRPLEFFWAGDDPKTGGVRVRLEWSERAKQSLSGKVPGFRRFSPQFRLDAAGEVTGAPLNMGGLVNQAAFKTITTIVAGGSGDSTRKDPDMDATQLAADLAAANQKITDLTAKLSAADHSTEIKAKEAEITKLNGQLTDLQGKLATHAKESAKAIVDAAVKAGKLAPQNTVIQAKWVDAISAQPELAATLNELPANPALATVVAAGAGGTGAGAGGASGEHQFVIKAKAVAEARKISEAEAYSVVAAGEPKLYEEYLRSVCPKK